MKTISTETLKGKIISKINKHATNVWIIHFTDGTSVELWAEITSLLPFLYLDNLVKTS